MVLFDVDVSPCSAVYFVIRLCSTLVPVFVVIVPRWCWHCWSSLYLYPCPGNGAPMFQSCTCVHAQVTMMIIMALFDSLYLCRRTQSMVVVLLICRVPTSTQSYCCDVATGTQYLLYHSPLYRPFTGSSLDLTMDWSLLFFSTLVLVSQSSPWHRQWDQQWDQVLGIGVPLNVSAKLTDTPFPLADVKCVHSP